MVKQVVLITYTGISHPSIVVPLSPTSDIRRRDGIKEEKPYGDIGNVVYEWSQTLIICLFAPQVDHMKSLVKVKPRRSTSSESFRNQHWQPRIEP